MPRLWHFFPLIHFNGGGQLEISGASPTREEHHDVTCGTHESKQTVWVITGWILFCWTGTCWQTHHYSPPFSRPIELVLAGGWPEIEWKEKDRILIRYFPPFHSACPYVRNCFIIQHACHWHIPIKSNENDLLYWFIEFDMRCGGLFNKTFNKYIMLIADRSTAMQTAMLLPCSFSSSFSAQFPSAAAAKHFHLISISSFNTIYGLCDLTRICKASDLISSPTPRFLKSLNEFMEAPCSSQCSLLLGIEFILTSH